VSSEGYFVLIIIDLERTDRTMFVIVHAHFGDPFSFLRSIIIFNVWVLVYIFVVAHEGEALVNYLPITFPINHISDLIPLQRVSLSPLYDSGGPVVDYLSDMF